MANYFARKAGNINAVDVWATTPGGTASDVWSTFTSADVLHSNNFAIAVNISTTVGEVRNDNANSATAGGSFTLSNGVTLTANAFAGSTLATPCVIFSGTAGNSATLVGNVTGGSVTNAYGANNASTGTLTITGNCTGGGGTFAHGGHNTSTGTLTITGNATGGSGGDARGCNNASTGTLTITGNCTGGSGNSAFGANNASTGTLTITGNATGGSGSSAFGCNNTSTGTMTVVGTINASEFNYGVGGGNRGQITLLTGPFIASTTFGVNPIACLSWRWAASLNDQTYITVPTNNLLATRNLVTPDNATNFPAASNVRSAITYGIGGALTGTCAVPPAGSVAFGVPVDNTTGTATLSAAQIWDYALSAITASSTIGTLLKTNIDATISSRSTATTAGIADAVWDEVLTGATHNVPTSAGRRLRQLTSSIVIDGEVVSATTNTVTLDAAASADDGAYDPALILITEGPGAGESRLILAYNGTTKTCAVDRDWKFNPTNASKYVIISDPGREHVNEGLAQGGGTSTITLNASASTNDDAYVGQVVFIRSGTGADQARRIVDYVGSTRVATVDRAWEVTPTTSSAYVMLPTGEFSPNYTSAAIRSELTPELDEIGEIHAIHGLKSGDPLTVTPTSRVAGAISQTISGDGTTTTTVSRD